MLWLLAAWRLLFGAAQAGCYPALTKVTRSWFPAARRTVLQGWIATTFGRSGGAMSPILLGTVLMGWLGLSWQAALLVLGAVGDRLRGGLLGDLPRLAGRAPGRQRGGAGADRGRAGPGSDGLDRRSSRRSTLPAGRAWRSRSLRFFVAQQFLDAGSDVVFVSLIGTYFLRARGLDIAADRLAGEPAALGRCARRHRGRLAQRPAHRRDGEPAVVAERRRLRRQADRLRDAGPGGRRSRRPRPSPWP